MLAALAVAVLALAPSKSYKAQRFDADIQVLPGGDLHVAEEIVFEFERGSFERVWRDIPATHTDGIDVIDATFDGRPLPRGEGAGQVLVTGRSRMRAEWHLPPTGPSAHTFGLTYLVHGVGRMVDGRDIVEWQPLPSEHRYSIDTSRVVLHVPALPTDAPSVKEHRAGDASVAIENGVIVVAANRIQANGWVSVRLAFSQGMLVQAQPQWELRREKIAATGPRWIVYAAIAFTAGLVLILLLRAGYSAPPVLPDATEETPPDALQPALAAALIARGDARRANPLATLLDLAERGAITIRELPRRAGVRAFGLMQVPGVHDLAAHEAAAIRIAFADGADEITLAKARGRLVRGGRRFSGAVTEDLVARGLLDPARKSLRDRVIVTSVTLILAGMFGAMAMIPLIETWGAWPLLAGLAVSLSGVAGVIVGTTTSALSDDGARQASRWRGFRAHLQRTAAGRVKGAGDAPAAWTVYAAALGVGYSWARYLKRHPSAVPSWFAALDPAQASAAWVAFVGSAGYGAGTAGGSGAAGGGGSGAA